ncbi:hypothetical protein shim_34500 [Shimia sp. SK013]|nr:hypothetical protein shim_34500 [Shimia sp. SK013]
MGNVTHIYITPRFYLGEVLQMRTANESPQANSSQR